MGFYFKIAPGVRIRASKGGMRVGIGPRAARVHVGGYRTGVSTGAGPFTLYRNAGRSRSTRGHRSSGSHRSAPSRTSIAAAQRQLAQASAASEAQQTADALDHILSLHRAAFPPTTPPTAPPPSPPDEAAIRARHNQTALDGISIVHRAKRAQAREAAESASLAEIADARTTADADQARAQRELDRHWAALGANDPDVVLATLAEAFADNETPAAAVGVTGDHVAVVVLVPGPDVLPERMPTRTPSGKPSFKPPTKTVRNRWYVNLVCGHLLATVRETFAVAPAIDVVRAAVVRLTPADAYGNRRHEVLVAATLARATLDGVAWDATEAGDIVDDIATEKLFRLSGQAKELVPVDIRHEPDLVAVLAIIDHE